VVEIHIEYLAVLGDDEHCDFILTRGIKGIPVPSCSQGWDFPRIKACTMADDNCGVWKFQGDFYFHGFCSAYG